MSRQARHSTVSHCRCGTLLRSSCSLSAARCQQLPGGGERLSVAQAEARFPSQLATRAATAALMDNMPIRHAVQMRRGQPIGTATPLPIRHPHRRALAPAHLERGATLAFVDGLRRRALATGWKHAVRYESA